MPRQHTNGTNQAEPTAAQLLGLTNDVAGQGFSDTGSFIHKPPRGWLHPDELIMDRGMSYGVRYIGCLEVNTSMKSLDFETRSMVAKESINRVCEVAGLKTTDKRRKVDKRITRMLATTPNMDHAGSNITLTITSAFLNLVILESGECIAKHEMPNISFASGGDIETLDFLAYVAKDRRYGRACFILECGGGLAQDVITTIGQAFELRFKEFLQGSSTPAISLHGASATGTAPKSRSTKQSNGVRRNDPEYYNDLPGKAPPDTPPPVPPLPIGFTLSKDKKKTQPTSTAKPVEKDIPIGNLIDLSTELLGNHSSNSSAQAIKEAEHNYANDSVLNGQWKDPNMGKTTKDPFDMQPFAQAIASNHTDKNLQFGSLPPPPSKKFNASGAVPKANAVLCKTPLKNESWFHSTISRKDSEDLVKKDGDFLVRESLGSPGQYVLTGMQHGIRKHLLLVDPEGVVRTKDRTFESVSHLINYHCDNGLPIISAESALVLKRPIIRAGAANGTL